jgi:hypothetical protein
LCRPPPIRRAWRVCRWCHFPPHRVRDKARSHRVRWDRSRALSLLCPRLNLLLAIRCRGHCLCRCPIRRRFRRDRSSLCRWATWRERLRRLSSVLQPCFPVGWRGRRRSRQRCRQRWSVELRRNPGRADRRRQCPCFLVRCQRGLCRRPSPAEVARRWRRPGARLRAHRSVHFSESRLSGNRCRRCWLEVAQPGAQRRQRQILRVTLRRMRWVAAARAERARLQLPSLPNC